MFATVYNKATGAFAASVMVNSATELAPVINDQVGVLLGQYDLTMLRVDVATNRLALTEAGADANYAVPTGPLLFIDKQ